MEQGTLHFGGGTVDFIGQHKVGEDGAAAHIEGVVFSAVDECTHDVGGEQVGGELNASELGVDERSERADGECFGQSRHTLEENVSVGEESDEQGLREMGLPHHDARHTFGERLDETGVRLNVGVQRADIFIF